MRIKALQLTGVRCGAFAFGASFEFAVPSCVRTPGS